MKKIRKPNISPLEVEIESKLAAAYLNSLVSKGVSHDNAKYIDTKPVPLSPFENRKKDNNENN